MLGVWILKEVLFLSKSVLSRERRRSSTMICTTFGCSVGGVGGDDDDVARSEREKRRSTLMIEKAIFSLSCLRIVKRECERGES